MRTATPGPTSFEDFLARGILVRKYANFLRVSVAALEGGHPARLAGETPALLERMS